jgi:hypothetical protein
MAGTTRFGYSGSASGDSDAAAPEPAPAPASGATVFGRDAHLALTPPAARIPSRSGKSGFPARAGFWGRRNTLGDLEAEDHGSPVARRGLPPLAQHALVVATSALLSFLAVLLALRLREPRPAPAPAPAPAATVTDGARGARTPAVTPAPAVLAPTFSDQPQAATTRPQQAPKPPRANRPARRASRPGGPGDRILPPTFLTP